MSQATLRALVSVVLSSSAIGGMSFRINGLHIHPGHFARLKTAIRAGKITFVVDSGMLAKEGAEATYESRSNTMTLRASAVQAAKDVPLMDRAAILHECFHAIADMDRMDSLSPTQEETCGAFCGCLYVLLHYARIWTTNPDGPLIRVCRRVREKPGLELWDDADFLECYERTFGLYSKSNSWWGRISFLRNGL